MKKIKILFYSGGILLFVFLLMILSRYLEKYIEKMAPAIFSKMNLGEISFSSMKIDYLSQALKLNNLKYQLKGENFEVSAQIEKSTIKFKRLLTDLKKPLRGIEFENGYVKFLVKEGKTEKGEKISIPPFLEGSFLSLKNLRFEITAGKIEAEGEILGFKTDKISEIINGETILSFKKLVLSSKEIPVRALSSDFIYRKNGIYLFNLLLDSEIGTVFAHKLDWKIGKKLDFDLTVTNLKEKEFSLGYGSFEGSYDLEKDEVNTNCSFRKAGYKKFLAEEGELFLRYSIKNKTLFVENGKIKYGDGFLKVQKGDFSNGNIRFEIELVEVPFEHLLLNTGHVETRVFNTYTGNIRAEGSIKPVMIKGDAELSASNFRVCQELYPYPCIKPVLKFPSAKTNLRFEIRPYGVEVIDVNIYLPDSKGYITADGSIFFDESLNLSIKVHSLEIGYLSPIAEIPMSGMMKGDVYITGPFNDVSVHYRGEIENYSITPLHFESGNYTIFYRNEILYYSGAVKTKSGGSLLADGFIDFSDEPTIHHISSFEEVETEELADMIGLPKPVKEEINKILARWNGNFLMEGSIKEKLPSMFGHLETSSATYLGEGIDKFYAEGGFSDGEVHFKGYGLKGNPVIFEGGYKNGVIYAEISGNPEINSVKLIKNLEVQAEVYGEIFSPLLALNGKSEDFSFLGEIGEELKEVLIINKDFVFYKKGLNDAEFGGCLVNSDIGEFFKLKDISSKINVCFLASLSHGKTELEGTFENLSIRLGNETFYLKEPVKIKDTKGKLTFEGKNGFVRLNLSEEEAKLTFQFPPDILSIWGGYEIKKGYVEGNLSFPLKEPVKNVKGYIRVENISVGLRYIKLEKIWGEGELDGKTLHFKIYSDFPTEINVEGTYSIEDGIISATIKTKELKIMREGLNAEINSSLRGILGPERVSLNGEVEFTKLFLPFDLSFIKNFSFTENTPKKEIEIENLRIKFPDVKIKGGGNDLNGKGEITLRGLTSVTASGKLNFEGKLSYLGKDFEIRKGEILWDGSGLIPFLDILAQTTQERAYFEESEITSSYEIYLTIKGSAESPVVELYSSPSLSREDLLALLFTGKTIKDIYENPVKGEGATAKIYEIGSGAILGKELESLKRTWRLDKFTIYPKYSETLHKTTTFMSVGKKIGEKLWMEYARDLNYDEQEFKFLWRPSGTLSVKSGWDNRNTKMTTGNSELGNISVDLILQYEF